MFAGRGPLCPEHVADWRLSGHQTQSFLGLFQLSVDPEESLGSTSIGLHTLHRGFLGYLPPLRPQRPGWMQRGRLQPPQTAEGLNPHRSAGGASVNMTFSVRAQRQHKHQDLVCCVSGTTRPRPRCSFRRLRFEDREARLSSEPSEERRGCVAFPLFKRGEAAT